MRLRFPGPPARYVLRLYLYVCQNLKEKKKKRERKENERRDEIIISVVRRISAVIEVNPTVPVTPQSLITFLIVLSEF